MTITPSPLAQQAHEADQIRQEQWDIFVASLRDYAHADRGWDGIRVAIEDAFLFRWGGAAADEVLGFTRHQGFGFPDLLRAIAQAMQADDRAKTEAMDRR